MLRHPAGALKFRSYRVLIYIKSGDLCRAGIAVLARLSLGLEISMGFPS